MNAVGALGLFSKQRRGFSNPQHAVVAYTENGELCTAEFRQRINGIAQNLLRRPEQRWALVCDDTLRFAEGFLALFMARKTLILPQAGGPANVLEAQAAAVLTDQPTRFPELASLDVTHISASGAPVKMTLDDESAIELYTSGSTGRPKRVDKRLGQLRAEAAALEAQWGERLGDAVVLGSVPHHHLYGAMCRILWPLWAGRAFFAPACAQPSACNAAARRFGRCVMISSPAFLTRIAGLNMLQPRDAIAAVFSSGAPLPEITAAKIANELGNAAIEIYGSSETGGLAWRSWLSGIGQTSWQPLTGVEIAAPENSAGLLRVRSPWTWQAGWVDTGDLAQALPHGCFLLRGRADGVLKVEDKRVSLSEMEQRLVAHEFVSETRLLLLEGKRSSVGAVVVLSEAGRRKLQREGTHDVRKLLAAALRDWYEPVLVPRKWRFVDALPVNAMGKIEHAKLQALFTVRR